MTKLCSDNVIENRFFRCFGHFDIGIDINANSCDFILDLRFLPRFLTTQCRLCIIATGLFRCYNARADEKGQQRRQEGQTREHTSGQADGHDIPEALNTLVLGQDQAAEPRDRG